MALSHGFVDEAGGVTAVERKTIRYTKSDHFVVPVGVCQLRVFAVGAVGGSGNGFGVLLNNGGEGGVAVSNIEVSAGESLEIFVGKKGQDGGLPDGGLGGGSSSRFEGGTAASGKAGGGGGGGGASGAIRVRGEELLVVAGGGGGGSGVGNGGLISRGGVGGSFGTNGRGLTPEKIASNHSTRGANGAQDAGFGGGGGGGGLYGGDAGAEEQSSAIGNVLKCERTNADVEGLVVVSFDQEV